MKAKNKQNSLNKNIIKVEKIWNSLIKKMSIKYKNLNRSKFDLFPSVSMWTSNPRFTRTTPVFPKERHNYLSILPKYRAM